MEAYEYQVILQAQKQNKERKMLQKEIKRLSKLESNQGGISEDNSQSGRRDSFGSDSEHQNHISQL